MTGSAADQGSPLGLAGLLPEDERLYRAVLRTPGLSKLRLSQLLVLPPADLESALERFVAGGLVRVEDDLVFAEPPARALGQVVSRASERLRDDYRKIDALRDLIPGLVAEQSAAVSPRRDDIRVQAVGDDDAPGVIRRLIQESTGDVLWFRPDQWRLPGSELIDDLVAGLIASGRRSRAIYPAYALEEAPEMIRARARSGEQVRIAASLPVRLGVFGAQAAFVPDQWGAESGRRLVVREHVLVGALTAVFESTWERAIAVPGLDDAADDATGARRMLLHQLSRGAKDEQIARALGLSLRTVRRRVADIMLELDAESRFQAGVEAVRRGWV
jgi:DNA-binding CsgD family transcriptional regulator